MIAFIDDHREVYGVEPICGMLRIAPSTYHVHVARRADPAQASPRVRQDLVLMEQIRRVHAANFGVYGARKVWRQLCREGVAVARCTVERLMRRMGLQGAVRSKKVKTTIANKATPCPAGKVNRQFRASQPNVRFLHCRLNETPRKRTVSANGVHDDDRDDGCRWSWPWWPDVAAAQAGCGAAVASWRGPRDGFAGFGHYGRDPERLARCLPAGWRGKLGHATG